MPDSRPTFRLQIVGKLTPTANNQTLVTLAEFKGSRVVEHISVVGSKVADLVNRIRELRGFIEAGSPSFNEDGLSKLGANLFSLMIQGKVKGLLDRATGSRGEILPCEIFAEDYEIAGWPWEFLYDASAEKFLCQELMPISRGIFTLSLHDKLVPAFGKIRLLMVIGVKPDDPSTTPEEEIKWMHEVFENDLRNNSVDIEVMWAVSPLKLERKLTENKYDIVHFFGHAQLDAKTGQGYLKLELPSGEAFRFDAVVFGQLMERKGLRLVFLNACESGRADPKVNPARSSIAAALLDRGIPAVIATQYSIPAVSAHYLSSTIYNSMLSGMPLAEAMRNGRRAMSYAEKVQFCDWGIPVLYTSDPDLIIFPRPGDDPVPSEGPPRPSPAPKSGSATIKLGSAIPGFASLSRRKIKKTRRLERSEFNYEIKVGKDTTWFPLAKGTPLNDRAYPGTGPTLHVETSVPMAMAKRQFVKQIPQLNEVVEGVRTEIGARAASKLKAKVDILVDVGTKPKINLRKFQMAGEGLIKAAETIGVVAMPVVDHAHEALKQFFPDIKLKRVRVALVDIDSKVGFLPELIKAANEAQDYYDFQISYLPVPSGVIRRDFEGGRAEPQLFLPRLDPYMGKAPQRLGVDYVCCLTRCMIAGIENGKEYWNYFASELGGNQSVMAISMNNLREYAEEAKASFAKAALYLCLGILVAMDRRWKIEYHDETVGCIFDFCDDRKDLVEGLKKMRFEHEECRSKIKDVRLLKALDSLLALKL